MMFAIADGNASTGNGAASNSSASSGNVMAGFDAFFGGVACKSGALETVTSCAAAMAASISRRVAPARVQSFKSLCGGGVTT